ncbi:MAG TPA: tRNA lysidine(34) synthetase TilS [Roseiflexaceae bacterium]|nr:tRNA lysidine(34) synthetase TilS [Roseiflexaceae bacterium]HMP41853.1 tRNA lysidine(34) synthetase TilS [Roseiflexaceae bacterium]
MRSDPLYRQVRALIAGHRMIRTRDPVIVAVSGGPDSLCLLDLLDRLRAESGMTLHVAHLDHQLRGQQSAAEAQFVIDEARRRGLPATLATADVAGYAAATRRNQYAAGRVLRYSFFAQLAQAINAQAVAVAHQADDQAETVLMHLIRGAGPAGLAAMSYTAAYAHWCPPQPGDAPLRMHPPLTTTGSPDHQPLLIRPLLDLPRSAIMHYCQTHNLTVQDDPSNADTRHTRARIRAELLPLLQQYNPQILAALGRSAAAIRDEHAFLTTHLDAIWPDVAQIRPDGIDLDTTALAALHPALQRAALRRAFTALRHDTMLEYQHIEAARRLFGAYVGARTAWPGKLRVEIGYDGIMTIGEPLPVHAPQIPPEVEQLTLHPGGVYPLADGWAISVQVATPGDMHNPSRWQTRIDATALDGALQVRRRRSGERLRPLGGRGERRLQDVLVDARVPRARRAAWPIIVCGEQIVWIAGVCLDRRYAVTEPETPQLLLTLIPPDKEMET